MSKHASLEGRVFISHSSHDKPFVRELNAALEKKGFKTWLDEKDLLVGDQLAKEIGEAIKNAGALVVVVSSASVQSDWLSYELNLAIERSIKGDLRIIPVVIDTDEMPDELKGRLYADFRRSFDSGLELVVRGLEQEAGVARSGWRATSDEIEDSLAEVFGGVGWATMSRDFGSIDYDIVYIRRPGVQDVEVAYNIVIDYLGTKRPLERGSFLEYVEEVQRYAIGRAMMISTRPVAFIDENWEIEDDERSVAFLNEEDAGGWMDLTGIHIVVVDASDDPGTDAIRARLMAARRAFETRYLE